MPYSCLLQFNFTRTTCEMSKVCVTDPNNCDPAGNSTCLFGSLKVTSQNPPNGFNLYNELSGMSSGYIALGLKPGQVKAHKPIRPAQSWSRTSQTTHFRISLVPWWFSCQATSPLAKLPAVIHDSILFNSKCKHQFQANKTLITNEQMSFEIRSPSM